MFEYLSFGKKTSLTEVSPWAQGVLKDSRACRKDWKCSTWLRVCLCQRPVRTGFYSIYSQKHLLCLGSRLVDSSLREHFGWCRQNGNGNCIWYGWLPSAGGGNGMECEHRWWRARLCASTPFTILTKLSIANQRNQTNKAGIYFNVSVLIGFHMSGFFIGFSGSLFYQGISFGNQKSSVPKAGGSSCLYRYSWRCYDTAAGNSRVEPV